jgi:hypothetical protein
MYSSIGSDMFAVWNMKDTLKMHDKQYSMKDDADGKVGQT